MRHKRRAPLIAAALVATASVSLPAHTATADDWPQWRGPARDAVAADWEPPSAWPSELRLVWEADIGQGDASPVVAGDTVFTFTRNGDDDVVSARTLADGAVLWQQRYTVPFKPITIVGAHAAGPWATPTVAGGRLFTFGITGVLSAWNAQTGERLWQREWSGEFKKTQPFYGASQSPLVVGERLIVHVGGPGQGALLALDAATGNELWRFAGDGPAYGSAIAIEAAGQRQIVTLTQRQLIGVALQDGRLLWQLPFQVTFDVTSLTPLFYDGLLYLAGGDLPLRAFRVAGDQQLRLEEVWASSEVAMQFSSPVVAAGRLYGFSQKNKGQLVALDAATGKTIFTGPPRQGDNAWLVAAADAVLVLHDDGQLEVLAAGDAEYRPLARYAVSNSTVWAHPALLQRHLLVKGASELKLWEIAPPR